MRQPGRDAPHRDAASGAWVPESRTRWAGVLIALLVAAPFLAAAVRSLAANGSLMYAGDQALIGLDTDDAGRLDQTVGPYSRFGWAHPGPVWFYLLAPVHWLGGSDSGALVAATLSVHALAALLAVAVVWRAASPVLALATALVIGLYVLRMPAEFFVDAWNPYALLLPVLLLLLVAVESVRRGSVAYLLGSAAVASFLVQTHVGAAPLASLIGLATLVGTIVQRRRLGTRTSWRPVAALGGLLVAMWAPPVAQQLAAAPGQGNLSQLVSFFVHDRADGQPLSLAECITAVGRVLAMTPYGWGADSLETDVSGMPASVALALAAQVAIAAALVAAGWWWRSATAILVGAAVLVALAAAVLAARTVTGPLHWYLIVWVSVLPAVTVVGAIALVLRWLPDRPSGSPGAGALAARLAPAGSVLVLLAISLGSGASLVRGSTAAPNSPGVHAVLEVIRRGASLDSVEAVAIDVRSHELWPIASGVAYKLTSEGHDVLVSASVAELFGEDRVISDERRPTLVLASGDGTDAPPAGSRLLGAVDTEIERASIYLAPAA